VAGPRVVFTRGYIRAFMINLMYEHCGRGADRIDAYCMIGRECIQIQMTILPRPGEPIDKFNAALVSR
jgi:hypothetical protein